ncbi:MAG: thioredoxin family protein [Chloroflexi bacterium]|nr:thioredoxin family protein [Chloroflexota bacterium]
MSVHNHLQLTGRELVLRTLRHESVPLVPWVPFAGVHAGRLKGYSAQEVLTDENKLVESLVEANRLYSPDGQPVLFDLQIEAEILGCDLLWAEKAPPSVASHPLADDPTIPTRLPEKSDGRLPLVLNAMRRVKAAVGDHTALYGLVCGPFTLASHLRGTEIFMDMMLNPNLVHELTAYTLRVSRRVAEFYIEAGMDVIAIVDPMVSQIGPGHFVEFFSAAFTGLYDFLRDMNVPSSFFVCGDATKNIEPMCQTGPDCISIDENINLPAAKTITDRYNITLGGNIPLTTVMLLGTQQDNMKFALDLLDSVDTHNLIVSPGCDMPYDVPPENTVGIGEALRNTAQVRAMLANYHAPELFDIEVELPDYAHLEKPLIEVFTLDSDSCAACMYMLGAAARGADEMAGRVDLVEYKFTERENVARCKKLGVKNLPSIYINGELVFSSIIPSAQELRAAIEKYLKR